MRKFSESKAYNIEIYIGGHTGIRGHPIERLGVIYSTDLIFFSI